MSSACVCHVENAFCFYCEVCAPVVAENERLKAEIKRLATPEDLAQFDAEHPPLDRESMEKLRKAFAEHVRAKRRLPDGTLEKTRAELEAEVESLRMQRDSLEATLQHYRGYA